jgi:hypothetical protein
MFEPEAMRAAREIDAAITAASIFMYIAATMLDESRSPVMMELRSVRSLRR